MVLKRSCTRQHCLVTLFQELIEREATASAAMATNSTDLEELKKNVDNVFIMTNAIIVCCKLGWRINALNMFCSQRCWCSGLKMETVCPSETFVPTYESVRRHTPEDQHRHLHSRENLTSHISHLTPHISHLTSHISHLTPHTSHLTPHISQLTAHTSQITPHTSLLTHPS
jgi:hypothetical protein